MYQTQTTKSLPPEGDGSDGPHSEVFSAGGYIAANPEDEPLSGHKIHHKIHKTVEDDSEDKQEEEENNLSSSM